MVDTYSGKHRICNYQYPIFVFPTGLNPGGYSLPFTLRLPADIPGSFHFQGPSNAKAKIEYKFHAKLLSNNNEKLKARTTINVRQTVYNYSTNIALDKNARLKTWCCVNKGFCYMKLVYPQDTYNPSQIAVISSEVENVNSKLNVKSLTSKLFYSLRLKDNHGRTHFVKQTLLSNTLPIGIAAGASMTGVNAVQPSLNLPSVMNRIENMYSTKGNLIDCVYNNEVSADMDGTCMCCGEAPSIAAVMNIVPAAVIAPIVISQPPGWNPTLLNPVVLQYDPNNEVPKHH